jgi:hypothetical protein
MEERYLRRIGQLFALEKNDGKQHSSWYVSALREDPENVHRLDHPSELQVSNAVARCFKYKAKCTKFNASSGPDVVDVVPNYIDLLVSNTYQIPNGNGSQLPAEQLAFIDTHAGALSGVKLLERALRDMDGASESLDTSEQKKKFVTRVGYVRGRIKKLNSSNDNSNQNSSTGGVKRKQMEQVEESEEEFFFQLNASDLPAQCWKKFIVFVNGLSDGDKDGVDLGKEAKAKFMNRVGKVRGKRKKEADANAANAAKQAKQANEASIASGSM